MNRKLRFPALNFHGGRVELLSRTEADCVDEAMAIYKATVAARLKASEKVEVGFTQCAPTASICDMHLRIGLILMDDETGEPFYESESKA